MKLPFLPKISSDGLLVVSKFPVSVDGLVPKISSDGLLVVSKLVSVGGLVKNRRGQGRSTERFRR